MNLELIKNQPNTKQKRSQTVLFVHGMWHGAWCWEPYFLPYFGELGYQAYALSLSNHANSPRRKSFNLLRISDYVNDLKETIDSMDQPPVLVGHSMGGYVVQKYLEKHTAPGATLLAPVPPFGIWAGTLNVLTKYPLSFLKANLTLNLKTVINDFNRYKHILCSDNVPDEEIHQCLTKIDTESFFAYADMLGLNLVNTKSVRTPLQIIGGGKDRAVPLRVLVKTSRKYDVSPVVFDEMGHNLMLEPGYKQVADTIDKWIQGL